MKNHKLSLFFTGLLFISVSCDKVKNPIQPEYVDINVNLLPSGTSIEEYKANYWIDFSANTNTNVNVMIEDFTGHKCAMCPYAALEARTIEEESAGRVFTASIHAGPNGTLPFQNTNGTLFSHNFTNPQGLAISTEITDGGFTGNPSGTVNRRVFNDQIFQNYSSWSGYTSTILSANDLKVNLQAITNYFPETRGVFLHTEIDVLETVTDDLYQVVYLIEDSLVVPQITPSLWSFPNDVDVNYVHRDIHRGCIDGLAMGRQLTETAKVDKNGNPIPGNKYYLNYSYQLPAQYNRDNMHLLIYVYNKTTKEIYQVIRKDF